MDKPNQAKNETFENIMVKLEFAEKSKTSILTESWRNHEKRKNDWLMEAIKNSTFNPNQNGSKPPENSKKDQKFNWKVEVFSPNFKQIQLRPKIRTIQQPMKTKK